MNTYEKSVMNISRNDVNWFQVCRRLAYKDPYLFNTIISELSNPLFVSDSFDQEIRDMVKDQGNIYAIKMVRARTGYTLKESKDYVDSVISAIDV